MENWKKILKLIEKWNQTKYDRLANTREDLFIEELNNQYILIKRSDADKVEIVFKPGIEPSEGIVIYGDADHEAMDQINKEIDDRTDDLAEEEVELNDAKTKDIPWDRLMMNKEWEFWPKDRDNHERKANVIINNPDLFL